MTADDKLFDALKKVAEVYGWELTRRDPGPCQDGACNFQEGHNGDHCYCVHTTAGECVYNCLLHDRRGDWEPSDELESWAKLAGIMEPDARFGVPNDSEHWA